MGDDFTSYSNQELLDRWSSETSLTTHDLLFTELQRRKLYPGDAINTWEEEAGLYPDTQDPYFIEKLMAKQEFAENLQESFADQKKRKVNPCDSHEEFELTPVQRFISRFMSPQCPYVSALLYHGVGVGKTCAAITTAETHLRSYPHDAVFIVAPRNIQPGFRRTIFDDESIVFGKEGQPNTSKGCTGNEYLKRTNMEFETDRATIQRRVNQSINSRYIILGYIQFYRYIQSIIDRVPKGLPKERLEQEEIKALRKEFSGRFVIIDEAHNLRDAPGDTDDENLDAAGGDAELSEAKAGKRLTPALLRVVQAAEGMKLMLLTGTPMYNSYREIIFILKLLLLNDKRAPLSERDIFFPDGRFRPGKDKGNGEKEPGGEEKLGAAAAAYLSFMRGENPLSFPVRLAPKDVPLLEEWPTESPQGEQIFQDDSEETQKNKRILLRLPFVPVTFEEHELKIIRSIADTVVETGGLGIRSIDEMVQSGNWLFPASDDSPPEMRIRDTGFDGVFEEVKGGTTSQFTSRVSPEWLETSQLGRVSPKAALILNRIPKAKGPVFIYSRFIKSGALPLAIALEANGYTPWGQRGPIFTNGVVGGQGRQCAICEARERAHSGKAHTFVPAKYILLTGQATYSPNNPAAIQASRTSKNLDGREIKVIIGSQVASEGIDLKFIREIYVFDSWFHLNKMEQVLGRGVRTCSHSLLPEEKRNCTIHLLVNSYGPGEETETADLYMYRTAMKKALQIGKVTRVLKRYALDCNLNHSAILIAPDDSEASTSTMIENIEDSQGGPRPKMPMSDTPYTSICDWMECEYSCSNRVDIKKLAKESKIDMSSYDEYAMRWRDSQIKQILKKVFEVEKQPMIQIDSLIETLRAADIPEIAIRTALSEIVGQTSFRFEIGGQEGYIIYRNTFYLFQPIRLADVRVPLALRVADVIVRKDEYTPGKIEYTTTRLPEVEAAPGAPGALTAVKDKAKASTAVKADTAGPYWNACTKWASNIRNGTAALDIPDDVLNAIEARYSGDEYKREFNILTMVSWMFEDIRQNTYPEDKRATYRNFLGDVLLEMVWDESLRANEQAALLKATRDTDIETVSKEQRVIKGSTEAFRYVSPTTGTIQYECGDGKCSEAVVRLFESDASNPINKLQANRQTSGEIYGFIIPKIKDGRLIFKTNDRPVDPGFKPEKGGECEIVSSIETHKKMLRIIAGMMRELGHPPFLLTDAIMNEKGARKQADKSKTAQTEVKSWTKLQIDSRKFQNVVKACALKNIILRFLDKLEAVRGGKRYFYRPISAIKSQHKLK